MKEFNQVIKICSDKDSIKMTVTSFDSTEEWKAFLVYSFNHLPNSIDQFFNEYIKSVFEKLDSLVADMHNELELEFSYAEAVVLYRYLLHYESEVSIDGASQTETVSWATHKLVYLILAFNSTVALFKEVYTFIEDRTRKEFVQL